MNKKEWIRQLELEGMIAPKPAPRPASHEDPPREYPKCVRCGGTPNLGRCGKSGKVESYCSKCADEEYLEALTPAERALLRR